MEAPDVAKATDDVRAIAFAMAHWWGDVLRAGAAPSLMKDAGYDRAPCDVMNGMMGDFLTKSLHKDRAPLTEEQIRLFETTLADRCVARIRAGRRVFLRCDYDPDVDLCAALDAAKIPSAFTLPYKTDTCATLDEVVVRRGYGGAREPLWQTKRQATQDALDALEHANAPWHESRHDWYAALSREEQDAAYSVHETRMSMARALLVKATDGGHPQEVAERIWNEALGAEAQTAQERA